MDRHLEQRISIPEMAEVAQTAYAAVTEGRADMIAAVLTYGDPDPAPPVLPKNSAFEWWRSSEISQRRQTDSSMRRLA